MQGKNVVLYVVPRALTAHAVPFHRRMSPFALMANELLPSNGAIATTSSYSGPLRRAAVQLFARRGTTRTVTVSHFDASAAEDAVMSVEPDVTPVTTPVALTEATLGVLELQDSAVLTPGPP